MKSAPEPLLFILLAYFWYSSTIMMHFTTKLLRYPKSCLFMTYLFSSKIVQICDSW